MPLLSKDGSRQWVIESLQQLREKFEVDLWAYVIMPEHVHILLRPQRLEYRMEHLLAALKRPISVRQRHFLRNVVIKNGCAGSP
jgi:putative transposase